MFLDFAKIQFLKAIHNSSVECNSIIMFLDFAKIQFLKAIHNFSKPVVLFSEVFRFCKNTIFESNSQLLI